MRNDATLDVGILGLWGPDAPPRARTVVAYAGAGHLVAPHPLMVAAGTRSLPPLTFSAPFTLYVTASFPVTLNAP